MMHQLLKQVVYGDRHASMKLLKGYFVLHRLLLHCCAQWPAIRDAADEALRTFASSAERRTKDATPWLAYVLQLLTVSNVQWVEVRDAFLEEALAREVQFTRRKYPHYRPVPPDDEGGKHVAAAAPLSLWALCDDESLTPGAERVEGESWRAPARGWCCLVTPTKGTWARHIFHIRVRRLPSDGIIRVGWTIGAGDCLVGGGAGGPRARKRSFKEKRDGDVQEIPEGANCNGWGYHCSQSFGSTDGWRAHAGIFEKYGEFFREGDVLSACLDNGVISFARNGKSFGTAFRVSPGCEYRPSVCMKRGAEAEFLPSEHDAVLTAELFASPEQARDMAWDGNRRGNTLLMFQVFFLSLVRPEGSPDWSALEKEYDGRLGFPAPDMSAALFSHFAEVHRIAELRGCDAWPLWLRMFGFKDRSTDPRFLDQILAEAYQRAIALDYKCGGRHDHA